MDLEEVIFMDEQMTIQEFSKRTGISKSAIRYYETKGLLQSVGRTASGYRMYKKSQIEEIKLISSLRFAEIPIKDIQMYVTETDEDKKEKWQKKWIEMIRNRMDLLNIGLRYLESNSLPEQIYLLEKESDNIIWFFAESKVGRFRDHFIQRKKEMEKLDIPIKSYYLKYLSGLDVIKAQIGFGVPADIPLNNLPENASLEYMPSCICIAMPFNLPIAEIQNGYQKLINYANEQKWIPTNSILEWYRGKNLTDLDLIMPVTQIIRRNDE